MESGEVCWMLELGVGLVLGIYSERAPSPEEKPPMGRMQALHCHTSRQNARKRHLSLAHRANTVITRSGSGACKDDHLIIGEAPVDVNPRFRQALVEELDDR